MDIFTINKFISIGDGIKHRDTNIVLLNSKYETAYEGKSKRDGTFLDTTTTDFPHKFEIKNNRISGEYPYIDIIDIRFIDNKTGLYMLAMYINDDRKEIFIRIPEKYNNLTYCVLKTIQDIYIGILKRHVIINDTKELVFVYNYLHAIY